MSGPDFLRAHGGALAESASPRRALNGGYAQWLVDQFTSEATTAAIESSHKGEAPSGALLPHVASFVRMKPLARNFVLALLRCIAQTCTNPRAWMRYVAVGKARDAPAHSADPIPPELPLAAWSPASGGGAMALLRAAGAAGHSVAEAYAEDVSAQGGRAAPDMAMLAAHRPAVDHPMAAGDSTDGSAPANKRLLVISTAAPEIWAWSPALNLAAGPKSPSRWPALSDSSTQLSLLWTCLRCTLTAVGATTVWRDEDEAPGQSLPILVEEVHTCTTGARPLINLVCMSLRSVMNDPIAQTCAPASAEAGSGAVARVPPLGRALVARFGALHSVADVWEGKLAECLLLYRMGIPPDQWAHFCAPILERPEMEALGTLPPELVHIWRATSAAAAAAHSWPDDDPVHVGTTAWKCRGPLAGGHLNQATPFDSAYTTGGGALIAAAERIVFHDFISRVHAAHGGVAGAVAAAEHVLASQRDRVGRVDPLSGG